MFLQFYNSENFMNIKTLFNSTAITSEKKEVHITYMCVYSLEETVNSETESVKIRMEKGIFPCRLRNSSIQSSPSGSSATEILSDLHSVGSFNFSGCVWTIKPTARPVIDINTHIFTAASRVKNMKRQR